jgi:delta(3,5)-delta(2,4)-dienoyl-CoA isomerase
MWHNLSALFNRLSVDPIVRTIVYSGAGRAFTAGLDVQAASEGGTFAAPTVDGARKANGLRRHILEARPNPHSTHTQMHHH